MAAIVFLVSHGIVKLALVHRLLRDDRWAYRPTLATLGRLAAYQLVVLVEAPSVGKAFALALDAAIIWLVWLVWLEWRSRRERVRPAGRGRSS